MKVEFLNTENALEWDLYIQKCKKANFMHQRKWKEVVEDSFGHKPFYLLSRDNGKVSGILPLFLVKSRIFGRALVCIPYSSYCGICAEEYRSAAALVNEAKEIANKERANYLEIRNAQDYQTGLLRKDIYWTLALDLPDGPETLWDTTFSAGVRNEIRKAAQFGLSVKLGSEWLSEFYKVVCLRMRELGTPAFPVSYLTNMFKYCPQDIRLFTAHYKGRVIGGALISEFKNTRQQVLMAFSLSKYFRLYPNMMLFGEILKSACERKIRVFDFGRSLKTQGTFGFKKQWGSQPKQLYYEYYTPGGKRTAGLEYSSLKFRVCSQIWRRLPLFVTQKVGPALIRQIPG